MLDFASAPLNDALAPGKERVISPLVEVDWERNDTFLGYGAVLNHEVISATMDDESDGALPDEVNGVVSASSTQLTVVVAGTRTINGEEIPLWKLFSPFITDLPYWKTDLSGAAIRYTLNVETDSGTLPVRQFTGWVRSVDADRITGRVTIVAANHLHLQGKQVTLPRWARWVATDPQLPDLGVWNIPDEDRMENAPLSFAWLWQYVMRSCDAIDGPSPRDGCIWFSSGYGGMIPEVGAWSDYQAGRSLQNQGTNDYVYPHVWSEAQQPVRDKQKWINPGFHAGYCRNIDSGVIFQSYSQSGSLIQIQPGPDQPRYLNGGVWSVQYTGAEVTSFLKLDTYMDSWQYILGEFQPITEATAASIKFTIDGTGATLVIRSTGAGADTRTITCAVPTAKDDFVYVSYEVDMAAPQNSKIFYNNVQQVTSSSGTLSTYPTVLGDSGFGADKSKVRVWQRQSGFINAEVWQSDAAQSTRVATWSNTSYDRRDFAIVNGGLNGTPTVQRVDIRSSYTDGAVLPAAVPAVTHIPIRENVDAWELLKELVKAAGATMMIDAYGGLRIIPQVVLEQIENRIDGPTWDIDGDRVGGFVVRNGFDQIRTAIRHSGRSARAVKDVAFEASSAKQFFCPAPTSPGGTAQITYQVATGEDIISVEPGDISQFDRDDDYDQWGLEGFHAVNIQGQSIGAPSVLPVVVIVYDLGRQDYFEVEITHTDPNDMYLALGTDDFKEPSQPGFKIEGLRKIIQSGAQVDTVGTGNRLLELPTSDFHSAPWTMTSTVQSILNRTNKLVPRVDSFQVLGDPRRELYDLITISDEVGGLEPVIAQITGRRSTYSATTGFRQVLTIRVLTLPGDWFLGVTDFSELDETTILG